MYCFHANAFSFWKADQAAQQDTGTLSNHDRYKDVMKWIAPIEYECNHYEEDFEAARELRHPETCEWICDWPEYNQWFESSKSRSADSLLWIHAIPGAGKTVLASHLIGRLTDSNNKGLPFDVLYFFFKHYDANKGTPLAAVRALANQLLHSPAAGSVRVAFFEHLVELMDRGGQIRAIGFRALWDASCKHVTQLPDCAVVIVLDALDECSAAAQLMPGLQNLARRSAVRILATSRREADLGAALARAPSLLMGVAEVRDDIRLFTEQRVAQSAKLSHLFVRMRMLHMLDVRSKGMFLWVALVLQELEAIVSLAEASRRSWQCQTASTACTSASCGGWRVCCGRRSRSSAASC
jgi:hypothetical protein